MWFLGVDDGDDEGDEYIKNMGKKSVLVSPERSWQNLAKIFQ